MGVFATPRRAVTRCISILMHLSLSLSLSWRGWLSSKFEFRRGAATRPGSGRREGFPRALRGRRAVGFGRRLGVVSAVVAVGVLGAGAESALALNEHVFSSSFGGSGASALSGPSGVAVNNETGDVYVVDKGHNRVEEFNSTGSTVLGEFDGAAAGHALLAPEGIAVDNSGSALDPSAGDVYVVDTGHSVIDKFSSSGTYIGQLTETSSGSPFGELDGVAVDAAGMVWVYQASGEIDSFSDALGNEYLSQRSSPFGTNPGFAVDSEDNLYVHRGSGFFAKLNSAGEALIGEIGIESESDSMAAAVNPSSDEVFIDTAHTVSVFSSSGSLLNRFGAEQGFEHIRHGSGIAVDTASSTVYVADAAGDRVDVFTAVVPLPLIDNAAAINVTGKSADLTAKINPRGFDTTYRFEYGTSTAYGTSVPIPDGDIGSGSNDVSVNQHLAGLAASTTYHYRVVARNALGTQISPDHTFIYATGGTGLPDNRAYEMVTPPHKNGALIGESFFGLSPSVAEDGARIILSADQCFGESTSCLVDNGLVGTPYAFTRTNSGWVTTPLSPPATKFAISGVWNVSADTDTALFSMPTQPSGDFDWYAREATGSFEDIGPMKAPSLGGAQLSPANGASQATVDLSHVIYRTTPSAWPFDATAPDPSVESPFSLYEYVGMGSTQPVLVGVSGGKGSTDLISTCGTTLGDSGGGVGYNGLSQDGRTVFFTAKACTTGSGANRGIEVPANELFARSDESRTVALSTHSPLECTDGTGCSTTPPGDAEFAAASADGSKAFFLDTQQLTDSASEDAKSTDSADFYGDDCKTTGANGCNLYEYDFSNPLGRNLVTVSAGDTSGDGPQVQGVLAVAEDGSHVYFVAKGVLTRVPNDQGTTAVDGANNLYVYERDTANPTGRIAFIASLSQADQAEWVLPVFANVTPDGRFLVFTSHGALTADQPDTTTAAQVFRYDAQTRELVRVSIGEGGFNDNGNAGLGDAHIVQQEASRRLGPPQPNPTMSSDGSYVFFESPVGLTPNASNDVAINSESHREGYSGPEYAENVYEYHDGHVYLISDGRDVSRSVSEICRDESSVCLLGTDASGRNVFFSTADRLSPSDTDTGVDMYDAHICSSGEPCVASAPTAPVPCQGEACHGGSAGVPSVIGVGTAVFSGPGNLTPTRPVVKTKAKKRKVKAKKKAGRRRSKRRAGKASRHVPRSRKGV